MTLVKPSVLPVLVASLMAFTACGGAPADKTAAAPSTATPISSGSSADVLATTAPSASSTLRRLTDAQLTSALLALGEVPAGLTLKTPSPSPTPSADPGEAFCDGKPIDRSSFVALKAGTGSQKVAYVGPSTGTIEARTATLDSMAKQGDPAVTAAVVNVLRDLVGCRTLTTDNGDGTSRDTPAAVTANELDGHASASLLLTADAAPYGTEYVLLVITDVDGVLVGLERTSLNQKIQVDFAEGLQLKVVKRIEALQTG